MSYIIDFLRINPDDTPKQVKEKIEKLFERVDELEKQVNAITDSIIKSDKVMDKILAQTERLLRELAISKSFNKKQEHES